jgi:hypothetical protein
MTKERAKQILEEAKTLKNMTSEQKRLILKAIQVLANFTPNGGV